MRLTKRVLLHKAKPIRFDFPWRNQNLADRLLRLMRDSHGIGLAAPQCGISQRLFVMQIDADARMCFNPEIQSWSPEKMEFAEGCLSYPGEECIITRPRWIDVRYQNHLGDWQQERLDGIPSICFQHELDHLDGITMWQRYKEQNAN